VPAFHCSTTSSRNFFSRSSLPFALRTGRTLYPAPSPRPVDIYRTHYLDYDCMNTHGPKFHRLQHTDFFILHKPSHKKETFTLIFIVTLMLVIITLRTSAAAIPMLVARPGSLAFGNVAIAGDSARTMTLVNSGNTVITISHVSLIGRGFAMSQVATPLKLAAGQSISFAARFAPGTSGVATGSIAITSNASDPHLTIGLSGTGVLGRLSATPASASFGDVITGDNSSKTLRLSNTGSSSLTISRVSVSGKGFSLSKVATPFKLAARQSVSLEAHFAPETAGEATGSIAITSNASDRSLTIGLSGTGVLGRLSATPASASFGDVITGDNSSKTLRLSNTGSSSLTISRVSASGKGFSLSKVATPFKLLARQSVSLEAHFAPETAGEATGSITITSNAPDPNLAIGLSGTGVLGRLSATPASASLGKVAIGETNSQTIRLNNTGNSSVTISRVNISGSSFKIAGLNIPTVIASGKSATFNAVFTPTASGSMTGLVSLISDAPNSPLTIPLSGSGLARTSLLEASPSDLNFGTVDVDSTSSLSVTLTNRGNADVTISKLAVSGAGFSEGGVAAGTILGPDQSTTLRVAFAPVSSGSVHGDVAVTNNAMTSPLTISLSGNAVKATAHSVALAWSASKSTGVVGYNVYRGTASGGPYTKLTPSAVSETRYTDTSVEAGRTYYYVVTSVDSDGLESSHSNQASATVPAS
jgi:P pilus assembly chaperone PapD